MITFEEYMQLAIQENNKWKARRIGQNYFNILYQYKPALAASIVKDYPDFDPFYTDDNLPRFLWHIGRCWDENWTNG